MTESSFDRKLLSTKVLICVGSGGVGKTTISSAIGVRAAQMGLRALVLTIDPSLRLKSALGINDQTEGIVEVPDQNYPGKLYALLLQPEKLFQRFIMKSSVDSQLSAQLLRNRLFHQLSTTLSGSQEFTSLLQLAEVVQNKSYDIVILDTPPAQHAVEFLEAPEKILALFQESVVKWFVGDSKDVGFIRKIISKSTLKILSLLEKVTGSVFMHELREFFASVKSVQTSISDKSEQITKILKDEQTSFVLVTGFAQAKIQEAEYLRAYLARKDFRMWSVVINRAFFSWAKKSQNDLPIELVEDYKKWHSYQEQKMEVYKNFSLKWKQSHSVIMLPDLQNEVSGLIGLEGVASELVLACKEN